VLRYTSIKAKNFKHEQTGLEVCLCATS